VTYENIHLKNIEFVCFDDQGEQSPVETATVDVFEADDAPLVEFWTQIQQPFRKQKEKKPRESVFRTELAWP